MSYRTRSIVPRLAALASAMLLAGAAQATVIYSTIPTVLAPNYASLGYEATSTSEFGDNITFAAGPRQLNMVTVTMSNWALESTYEAVGTSTGYMHNLTFNIYANAADAAAGSSLVSKTINAFVPWRPEADATCAGGTAYRAGDLNCYNGLAFNVTFDFSSSAVLLPNDIVFGLAFNTADYGKAPIHAPGPYNSLNFALEGAFGVGTDPEPDSAFWNSTLPVGPNDPSTRTPGVFSADSGWTPYVPMVSFDAVEVAAVPEPGTLALAGVALAGMLAVRRRRQS